MCTQVFDGKKCRNECGVATYMCHSLQKWRPFSRRRECAQSSLDAQIIPYDLFIWRKRGETWDIRCLHVNITRTGVRAGWEHRVTSVAIALVASVKVKAHLYREFDKRAPNANSVLSQIVTRGTVCDFTGVAWSERDRWRYCSIYSADSETSTCDLKREHFFFVNVLSE